MSMICCWVFGSMAPLAAGAPGICGWRLLVLPGIPWVGGAFCPSNWARLNGAGFTGCEATGYDACGCEEATG